MSTIENDQKVYNSAQIIENDGQWTSFERLPGSEVELFLKDKLEDSVVDFKYYNTDYVTPSNQKLNNVLVGLNAFGREVCYTQVINVDPTYEYTFDFKSITVGTKTYTNIDNTTPVQINKSDSLEASIIIDYLITGNIAGNTFNEKSPQSVTFKWFEDKDGTKVDGTLGTFTKVINPGEGVNIPITKMFEYSFTNRYLGIVFKMPKSSDEIVQVFKCPFTLRKLELFYNGNLLINSDTLTNLELQGTGNDSLADYTLEYYVDKVTTSPATVTLTNSTIANQISFQIPNLSEGPHDVFVRALSNSNLASNYIQISFIYQKTEESTLQNAIAMVTEVPNEISNCNLSKFFTVVTTSNLSGNIEIVALKSSVASNISTINTIEDAKKSNFLFKEISLNLLSTDVSEEIPYTSYIEIPTEYDTTEYLKILIKDGSGPNGTLQTRALNYFSISNNSVRMLNFQTIKIVNPNNALDLQYSKGEILNFSQISNGNFFTDLNPNLDSSDGIQLEQLISDSETVTMTAFKVSPTSGVFATPKKLLSSGKTALHKGAFSIEMMFKTYGISDLEDKIMTIGNITLCPKHIFLNYNPEENTKPHHTVNASRADFRKEDIQHIVITYDPKYKPSTYEKMYDMFFTSGSTTYSNDAQSYECLKIYVNGTINRVISVNSNTICEDADFNLQIHPTNSSINYYIFRTYDRALTNDEVKKNRISSMSKIENKQAYYLDNDILYLASDFSVDELSSKQEILNTISLGKCINKFKSKSDSNKTYKDRKVLLLAMPNGTLPPYFGNRKKKEPKAAFLVHYPEIATESGYTPDEHSGRLCGGKVKPQGSSAKKYMFHNTSYSKFTFTPESQFKEENPTSYDYYKMPGSDIEIKKLVGKVNYASSMQSHKQGACKLFHEGYVNKLDTSWMNGGRKAVLEDDFLYFWVNVPEEDLANLTWDYFREKDSEGNKTGYYNFENCYFLGFQTWGSAKGDEPTSGYSDATPHYLMLEGADNDNASANFKTPWAAMQIWGHYNEGTWTSANSTDISQPESKPTNNNNYYHQFAGGTKGSNNIWTPDYLTGLLIDDETIVFNPGTDSEDSVNKKADAWDVDFGCTEGEGYAEKGNWYLNGEEVDENEPGAVQATEDNLFFVFEDKAKESLKRFAEFYNLVYTFDFSSLLYIPPHTIIDGKSMEINGKSAYQYKLVFGDNCTINYGTTKVYPNPGDIYRWDKSWPANVASNSEAQWVPAGLYHNGTSWENLNVADICTWYCNASNEQGTYPEEYKFFSKSQYKDFRATDPNGYKYVLTGGYEFQGYDGIDENTGLNLELKTMQECMAEAFKIVMHEYLDVEDVSYHQAFIKLVAGTDNRAKNTYFQIVGPIYTSKYITQDGSEVDLVKVSEIKKDNTVEEDVNPPAQEKLIGYIKDNVLYEVNIDGENVIETGQLYDTSNIEKYKKVYYKKTDKGDFKIRLYADDLDTIFKTDNNGQQVKPYYLLEPPYNKDLEELWGDMHSGFFYNYDLLFMDKIKTKLSDLLIFATGTQWPDITSTKMYEYFLSIQNNIPSIAYTHHSEIYYESSQTLFKDGNTTAFYDVFAKSGEKSWEDFNNNKVQNPVSLSHGSCLEAEIEYLRDRFLMLSTYVNAAKNATGTSITLDGGSATTAGKEVVIAANYTSFIQHIYPIICNISSTKTTSALDFDPLLDFMWDLDTQDYNVPDLVYNIATPNEPVDLSVTLQTSSLTSEAKWTSTDLYRTINLVSGASAFTQMLNFPNASTVISQDPLYKIEMSQRAEIEAMQYLEGVEHLVLQSANISSTGFDFTGCNRLKTLILGKTENTLTDSPEGTSPEQMSRYAVEFEDVLDASNKIKLQAANASTGFTQVILPKSSSLEQIVLPNCVKVINISYYPNLTRFEFNTGTQLTNLTIDGRNNKDIIEYIINNFVGTYTTNLEITNIPDNFWLSEDVCRKLTQINNVKITGTVKIGDGNTLSAIHWTTKKVLVEKFGDISKDPLKFLYTPVKYNQGQVSVVNATGIIESSGLAPVNLSIEGNEVPLAPDGKHLGITYAIKDTSGNSVTGIKFEDPYVPYLTINEGLKGEFDIHVTVACPGTIAVTVKVRLTVGFYAPKVGDFAYANGTFSSIYDSTQGVVGIVFYSYKTGNSYDVRVLSADWSSTNEPLGPSDYTLDDAYFNSSDKLRHQEQKDLLTKFGLNADSYISDVVSARASSASGTIDYNSTLNGVDLHKVQLSNSEEHNNQKQYITRANTYLTKLKQYEPSLTVTTLEEYGWTVPTKTGKLKFEQALEEVSAISTLNVNGSVFRTGKQEGGLDSFKYCLYPAFLKALYYAPNVTLSGKGSEYFDVGNWYVPDSREVERIIYYRINSSSENTATSKSSWNNTKPSITTINGVEVYTDIGGKGYNVFKKDAFAYIKFLTDSNRQITSEGTDNGEALTYGHNLDNSQSDPIWSSYCSSWRGISCARDIEHNISPVCRIILTET